MKTITFKVSDSEAERIRRQAKRERVSVSEYLRRRAVNPELEAAVGKVRCEFTGVEIFAPIPGSAPLTTGTVREMLAEFP
ncbi:MAG: ribbon-helix-helix protein, CopG family [Verrucomicrobiota bacterium]